MKENAIVYIAMNLKNNFVYLTRGLSILTIVRRKTRQ